ncbi:MAG: YiiD C-terminal domain-containing protein [Pseudomonadota bacterium]
MIEPKFKDVAEVLMGCVEGIKRTGIRLVAMRDLYAKALMPLAGNTNHFGVMYAGSLFTLGEISGGLIHVAAFDVYKWYPIVKEVKIKYLKPAATDVTMEVSLTPEEAAAIEKKAEEAGKADILMKLDLKDAQGVVVAEVSGVWQVRRIPEGMVLPSVA